MQSRVIKEKVGKGGKGAVPSRLEKKEEPNLAVAGILGNVVGNKGPWQVLEGPEYT